MDLMKEGPRTTGQLWKQMPGLSRFAVMQHLRVLAEAGLVLIRKEGRERFNYVNPVPLREMYERWVSGFSSRAAETALRLKQYLDSEQEKQMEATEFRLVKLELEMHLKAPVERVFKALTEEYTNWWPHRFKPDSTVYFETEVNGDIGERFANGGGAHYGKVVYLDPPYHIATSGMSALTKGMVAFSSDKLSESDGGTLYQRSLSMWGAISPETEAMFRDGTRAIMEQALRRYVEEGIGYSPEVS